MKPINAITLSGFTLTAIAPENGLLSTANADSHEANTPKPI